MNEDWEDAMTGASKRRQGPGRSPASIAPSSTLDGLRIQRSRIRKVVLSLPVVVFPAGESVVVQASASHRDRR